MLLLDKTRSVGGVNSHWTAPAMALVVTDSAPLVLLSIRSVAVLYVRPYSTLADRYLIQLIIHTCR